MEIKKFAIMKWPFIQPYILKANEIYDFSVAERADATRDIEDAQGIKDMLCHISSEVVAGFGVSILVQERLLVAMPIAEVLAALSRILASANTTTNESSIKLVRYEGEFFYWSS
jgi:hypothetical protein